MIEAVIVVLGCLTVYLGTVASAFGATMRLSVRLLAERESREPLVTTYLNDPALFHRPSRLLLAGVIALATVAVSMVVEERARGSVGIVLIAIGGFIVVCEHLLPFLIVRRDPEAVLEALLPSFHVAARVLAPLTRPVTDAVAARHERALGTPLNDASGPAPDGSSSGADPTTGGLTEERRLLQSIVDFSDTLVRDVMTPRPDVVAVSHESTLDEIRAVVKEEQYSRIPVYSDNLDNIVGVIFVKDLIRLWDERPTSRVVDRLVRPAYFVPETKYVADLLKEFQVRHVQMAIVVDEYGGTAGLVTLEDLIEEIVGEIRDEHDVETEPIVEEAHGVFLVSGRVDIDEVAERLGVRIERQGFATLGGYLLAELGRVPAAGESFAVGHLEIEVVEAERRRVTRVRLRRQTDEANAAKA